MENHPKRLLLLMRLYITGSLQRHMQLLVSIVVEKEAKESFLQILKMSKENSQQCR
jgi:hypothetical protein